jgi:CRP-like cAMP-binding protein
LSVSYQQVLDFINASPFFMQLNEGDRQRLVREFDLISLIPDQVLFRRGEEADAFYLVLEGRLTLTHEKNRRVVNETQLKKGDPVGEEAFIRAESYRSTVTAESDVILLRIHGDRLRDLVDQYPRLAGCRSLFSGTVQLSRIAKLDWLSRDERLVILTRRHSFFFIARAFAPIVIVLIGLILLLLNLRGILSFPQPTLVALAVCMAAALLWVFWAGLDWSNDYYILTTRRLVRVDRTAGVFDRREEVPLGNIMAVEMTTTAFGKMYGFADIISRTYNTPVVWHGIANPELYMAFIQLMVERAKSNHAELEMDAMQSALGRQIDGETDETGGQIVDEPVTGLKISPPVTFRKHWIILFQKTWFPFTFGMAGIFILLGGLSKRLTVPLSEPIKWLLGVAVVIFFIWYLFRFLDWSNDIYQVTSDQIMDVKRTPLGREDRKTAMLENILSINYRRRGLLGVLLNYGTVNIQVGTESLVFDYVRDPSGVQREIFLRMAERQNALRQADIDSERDRMSQWITAYHRRINE